jgi:hypothetical protein
MRNDAASRSIGVKDGPANPYEIDPQDTGALRRRARLATPRLTRELKTMRAMLGIWCRDHHGMRGALCVECQAFMTYATRRLAGCPYGANKPTCSNCRIHCYGPHERAHVRDVMRYTGPRMLARHPWLAIAHLLDGRRPAPPKPRGAKPAQRGDAFD